MHNTKPQVLETSSDKMANHGLEGDGRWRTRRVAWPLPATWEHEEHQGHLWDGEDVHLRRRNEESEKAAR